MKRRWFRILRAGKMGAAIYNSEVEIGREYKGDEYKLRFGYYGLEKRESWYY